MLGLGYLYLKVKVITIKVKVITLTFTGSLATNPLGRWSLFDAAVKCVHPASDVGRGPTLLGYLYVKVMVKP